jgi:hypothetical protein
MVFSEPMEGPQASQNYTTRASLKLSFSVSHFSTGLGMKEEMNLSENTLREKEGVSREN